MEQWFPMILGSCAKIFIDRHTQDPVQRYLSFMYNSIYLLLQQYLAFMYNGFELLCTTVIIFK